MQCEYLDNIDEEENLKRNQTMQTPYAMLTPGAVVVLGAARRKYTLFIHFHDSVPSIQTVTEMNTTAHSHVMPVCKNTMWLSPGM